MRKRKEIINRRRRGEIQITENVINLTKDGVSMLNGKNKSY